VPTVIAEVATTDQSRPSRSMETVRVSPAETAVDAVPCIVKAALTRTASGAVTLSDAAAGAEAAHAGSANANAAHATSARQAPARQALFDGLIVHQLRSPALLA